MASRKNVSANEVRTYLLSPEGQAALTAAGVSTTVGKRGRHNPAQIAVFHKQNPRKVYETKVAESKTITVPVTSLDKAGRKTTKSVTITTEAARAALGHPKGRRGRFSLDTLSLALSAAEADKVADTFA